jgi:apolipoprotein D and lipocalin family protein
MAKPHDPLPTVARVDLNRFMGDWYVIANIPTRIERGAHNAVESYRLAPDGRILTTFTFRKGAFDGPPKKYEPVGYVRDTESNAVWGMQFVWPIKADYRIVYLDPAYNVTVVAREARDYVWVLARTPEIEPAKYRELVSLVERMGYDVSKLQQVPQKW